MNENGFQISQYDRHAVSLPSEHYKITDGWTPRQIDRFGSHQND